LKVQVIELGTFGLCSGVASPKIGWGQNV